MILVTGANGLVGSFVCRALKGAQISFKGLVREGSELSLVDGLEEDMIFGDFLNIEFLNQEIQNFNVIIHCAAIISFSKRQKEEMYHVNVVGTKQLVDIALTNKIDYFIQISSVAAIGRNEKSKVVDETNLWVPSKSNTAYGESKYLSELEVWRGIQEGLKACIVNPSVILAPGDWDKSSTKLFKYVWNENKYYGIGKLNYVDVRDVVDVIMHLLKTQISNERFILSAAAISYKSFFETVAKAFKKRAPHIPVNKWIGELATIFFQFKSFISNSEPLVTKEAVRVSNDRTVFDNQKIKKMLNFNFRNLEDTVSWSAKEILKKIAKN